MPRRPAGGAEGVRNSGEVAPAREEGPLACRVPLVQSPGKWALGSGWERALPKVLESGWARLPRQALGQGQGRGLAAGLGGSRESPPAFHQTLGPLAPPSLTGAHEGCIFPLQNGGLDRILPGARLGVTGLLAAPPTT